MADIPHNPLENPERPEITFDLPDGSNEQISIIIVHKDRPEYLNICLQSIHIMSNMNNYEVIVVDNNSGQETQEYLDVIEEEGIKVVREKENLYWSKAANKGAEKADSNSKYLVFMHYDTVILNPAWLDLLINASEAYDSGMVGIELGEYMINRQKIKFIQEWCVLMTRECWEDSGKWPEELPVLGHSFIYTLRATHKGYKPQAVTNPIVHHYKAFAMNGNEFERFSEEAMAKVPKLAQQAQMR